MLSLFSLRPLPRVLGRRLQSSGSFFNEISQSPPSNPSSSAPATDAEAATYVTNKDLRRHPEIEAKLNPAPKNVLDLLSPLKRKLYEANLAQNNGVYVNNQPITLDNKTYKLNLSRAEQVALEPSVYAQSYRIKGSWKKSYMWLRPFRRMALNDAITQCHFSARRMAKDVGEMLERASKDAVKLGMKPEELVLDQIWVGKDGGDQKRLQCKGRGRTGVITSPYVHVKAILKPQSVFDQRKEYLKKRNDRKLWFPLRNWNMREDRVQTADYKW